jgi:hypothetical protein
MRVSWGNATLTIPANMATAPITAPAMPALSPTARPGGSGSEELS